MSAPDFITCRYEGGPLDGRIAHHIARPTGLAAPILHRHRTGPKDIRPEEGANDLTAAGMYRLEERELLAPDLPGPPLDAEAEEAIGIEPLHEAKSKPRPKQFEFVAVHHPSKWDEEWHKVEPVQPEPAKTPPAVSKKPKKVIKLPDNHPLVRTMTALAAARKASEKKEEKKKDGPG